LPPLITQTVSQTRQALAAARAKGLTVGLIPTMGALHAGHVRLIRAARAANSFVVVSIFLNPTQFGPGEDLSRYPRPFETDVAFCAAEGVDLVFYPEADVMYPAGYHTFVEVQELQNVLCGASRPGHFRGVATVVLKLFNIIQPNVAYFGQKDAQQLRIIEQMVRDLDVPIRIEACPIVREADGLALSSRNMYLNPEERRHATVLSSSLRALSDKVGTGERRAAALIEQAQALIAKVPGARVDYVSIVDADSLKPLEILQGKVLVALAVFIGRTRLIDNIILQVKD
jgi:pantoate--beta-alanine ligase